MNHKLLVIVPYRDRAEHLSIFIPYITNTLSNQNIDYKIVVIEQNQGKLFNRGLLCNIGFKLYSDQYDYICIHDIDMIGENFDYSYEPYVTHLSALEKRRKYKEWYSRYLGGVTLFPKEIFININGFSNEYWGWGVEDDDLKIRCDVMGYETKRKQCRYYTLPHPTMPHSQRLEHSPGYKENINKIHIFQQNADKKSLLLNDGLTNIDIFFNVESVAEYENYNLTKVIV
jgi:hypothetical protein